MHIRDGFVDPAIAIVLFAVAIILLVISWKKVKTTYTQSFAAILAISSALVFAAQMINFPSASRNQRSLNRRNLPIQYYLAHSQGC